MKFKICTMADLDACIDVIKSHSTINKMDTVSTGLQASHIERFSLGASGDLFSVPVAVTDDDDNILLISLMRFAQTAKIWWTPFGYASELGRKKFGHRMITQRAMEGSFEYAESRGYYDVYYTIRPARDKLLRGVENNIPILKNYVIQDLEIIEPFSHSKFELIRKFLMGERSGTNPSPLILKRIYRPDKCSSPTS